MKPIRLFWGIIISIVLFSCGSNQTETIDLSGQWQFQMDPKDQGAAEKWFDNELPDIIQLPGSMVENGKGYDITLTTKWTGSILNPGWFTDPNYAPYEDSTHIKFPFWLQPEKKYTGAAWYRKIITLTKAQAEKNIWLKLERPHWESTVWINGQLAGSQNSLGTPHTFNISPYIKTGENVIAVRIDNRVKDIDPGENSHSISDHTQSNWNGIVGKISLQTMGNVYFENVKVFPDITTKKVQIKATIFSNSLQENKIKIPVFAKLKNSGKETPKESYEFVIAPGQNIVKMQYNLGTDALLWDEFNPNVYTLFLQLKSKKITDRRTVDFGLREFKVNGNRFAINGRPVFLRGTLECAIFPKTGYPPTDISEWEKVFTAVKAHGLNHVRFHSWCPPEAVFKAADEMGVYLQVECSSWANQSTQLGSGLPIDQYIWDESKHIVEAYGNHPSFVMMTYGNEPGGPGFVEFLTKFVTFWKEKDNRRLYSGASGWPAMPVNNYNVLPQPRIQGWGEQLKSIINAEPPKTNYDWSKKITGDSIPVVSHEIGQWCVYPNFKEIKKYTGILKPKNFELFRESLNAHHMGELADSFLLASGKLQALCYKAEIEAALRTPNLAGFQLLDLHDFPGQGTALVGVLDPFWEEKGYISPDEYRRFCNTTVPLARLDKRIFNEGDTLVANIEVAHFGAEPLKAINPVWKITSNGKTVAEGTLGQRDIPIGNSIALGQVIYQFQKEEQPRKMTLEVAVGEYINSWDLWVYPTKTIPASPEIRVVENLSASTVSFLKKGGKVLLSLGRGKVAPEMGGNVGIGFSSIFWNTAWTGGQKPHTLGILCNPDHPALKLFPSEYFSNWQWWDAMSHADAVQLDSFPVELKPIVRIIDDWVTNRRLALITEAKVGNGSLLISGVDLVNNLKNRPEARQLKSSLLNYMGSKKFHPMVELKAEEVKNILK